jgi:ABC-2 type transport system permease protein
VKKIWLMARSTYRRHIWSGTFLILTFGLPALMIIAGAIPVLSMLRGNLPRVGYVDQTEQLSPVSQVRVEGTVVNLRSYENTDQALAALEQGKIDGYLVIPIDYFQGQAPIYYGEEEPGPLVDETLTDFMRRAMLANRADWVFERLADPSQVTYVASINGEEVAEGPGLLVQVATPAVLALVFGLVVFTSASQLGSAVVREKDQRSMEMIITSLSPRQLVVGKVLGMSLLTATQIAVWATGAGIAIGLALVAAGGQMLSIPWEPLTWAVLLGVPGYFLYAVLAAGLGIIAGDRQQARQLAGLLGFVGLSPLYLMGILINKLDSPLALGLTWFPLTAPMIVLFRMALSQVPTWQLVVSLAILIASLAASVWFVARIFRAAMLMYGQSLHPKQVWQALRQA